MFTGLWWRYIRSSQADEATPFGGGQTYQAKRNGFFVEIGSYDGESLSDTLFFQMRRNLKGLLIEANPRSYRIVNVRDRRCAMVNACISRDVKSIQFKHGVL